MTYRSTLAACALLAAGSFAVAAPAVAQQTQKPEQLVKYRQSVYSLVGWNFGAMAAAVQGKIPYAKDSFARYAGRVAVLAPMAADGFVAQSLAPNSKAKPEIWTDKAEFDRLMQNFVQKTAALNEASKSGDLAKIRPAFQEAGQSCKACHDKFKKD